MRLAPSCCLALAASIAASPAPVSADQTSLQSLSELRWKHRIILVAQLASCEQDISRLRAAHAEVVDRDILWFAFCDKKLTTNYSGVISDQLEASIRENYFSNERTGAVLIGKDGGVKNRAQSLDLAALNQQIDSMPMRQREMREQSQ